MGLRTSPKASRQMASLAPNSSRRTAFFVSSEPLPKRLPLMSNSAFLSALVLGLAIFGDMDQNHAPTSQSRRCPDVTSPVLGPRFPDEQPPRSRGLLQTCMRIRSLRTSPRLHVTLAARILTRDTYDSCLQPALLISNAISRFPTCQARSISAIATTWGGRLPLLIIRLCALHLQHVES